MFNIFKKTDDPKDCYLIASNVLDKKKLDEDTLDIHEDLLKDPEVSEQFKFLIKNFLLPYKISLLKWTLNKKYFEDPFPVDYKNNHKHIAPSLKVIKENPWDRAMGYPNWFYIAFPDVALWAIKGEGNTLMKNKFNNYSEEQLTDGKFLRPNVLNDIIQMYLKNSKKNLECKKY